jgi:hypothetical protein
MIISFYLRYHDNIIEYIRIDIIDDIKSIYFIGLNIIYWGSNNHINFEMKIININLESQNILYKENILYIR